MTIQAEPAARDDHQASVVAANQRVHTQVAELYNEREPHFRPENKAKVRARLVTLADLVPSRSRMLDLGCGTGFLLDLAHDLFEQLDGIDATQAMLNRVDCGPGNIRVQQGLAERVPFDDGTFDLVTAYSFWDHLADHHSVLAEAHRVLKPGGVLYIDLVPNRAFWQSVYAASQSADGSYHQIVDREIYELVNHERKLHDQFGIDAADWHLAEPAKANSKGFDPDSLISDVSAAGFSVDLRFEWYLGQAAVMHGTSPEAAAELDQRLRDLLPVSANLFKYLVITATKL
jgi:ubiquinone/menaquinone biosynthesis C-methylase UbiE